MGAHRARGSAGKGLLVFFLALIVLASAAFGFYRYSVGASGPSSPVAIEIPEGANATDVGELLEDAGVVRSGLAFRLKAGFGGVGESLLAGSYDMRTNMTVDEALSTLQAGPIVETVSVTIPEGLELDEIAAEVSGILNVDPAAFEDAATSGELSLPPYLPEGTETAEGFLFPKTYEFSPDAEEEQVIATLLAQFEEEAATLDWSKAQTLGLSPYEVVIVASLIEREARAEEDRAKVSAVIHNRLREGMALQIDATVQYALPEKNRLLTLEDYEYESPYNTYLHPGLPPTPIASPGLASLQAALNPADEDYLYFLVVDPETGAHEFAETYEEFLRLKQEAGLT
ncbi:MAG: endolytic transglycosylase MltG [Actinomycetota bacterium]